MFNSTNQRRTASVEENRSPLQLSLRQDHQFLVTQHNWLSFRSSYCVIHRWLSRFSYESNSKTTSWPFWEVKCDNNRNRPHFSFLFIEWLNKASFAPNIWFKIAFKDMNKHINSAHLMKCSQYFNSSSYGTQFHCSCIYYIAKFMSKRTFSIRCL